MRDAAHHLAERRQLLRLLQFRLKYQLRRQVAVNLDSSQVPPENVQDWPRGPLHNPRRREQ